MKHAISLAWNLAFVFSAAVAAQTDTTFTYQGKLIESGNPANGSYNMDFALWDALSGGSQVGSTIQFHGLPVTDGLFTVELDYGVAVFDGSQLWLEIAVDGNELTPRQPITGTPYAIQTRGIVVDANNNVGIGTTNPVWELEVANLTAGDGAESAVTADDASGAIAAYSSTLPPPFEHFAGRISLFSNAITLGLDVRSDASSGDIRFFTGGPWPSNERMRITDAGRIGIGTSIPQSALHVARTDPGPAIYGESDADWGMGVQGRATASSGAAYGVYGESVGGTGAGAGVYGRSFTTGGSGVEGVNSSPGGYGVVGEVYAASGVNYGVYGKSNSTSGYDFYAAGEGQDYGSSSSIRWKNNISNIDDPLEKITALRGVYFDWDKEHGGHHDVGMIAEEVGAVLPEIVTYEDNGIDAHGMDYSKLTPLLVEAVNALRTEKDAEIAELRQRISNLEQIVERLAAKGTEDAR